MMLACAAMLVGVAVAADPQVPVQAQVIYASTAPGVVEPGLQKVQAALSKVKYATVKKVSEKKLELTANRAEKLELPTQKTAEVTLQGVKDNIATLKVKTPVVEATYSLAREKSLYIQAGGHDGGDLWLLLSQPK